jgi:hypothetical protein
MDIDMASRIRYECEPVNPTDSPEKRVEGEALRQKESLGDEYQSQVKWSEPRHAGSRGRDTGNQGESGELRAKALRGC